MKVNPLMTVWLLSCVITYPGLSEANRYSRYKYDKKNYGTSELARLYGKDGSLASYKLNVLRLLSAEKKKKKTTTETTTTREVTDFDACASSSSTTATTTKSKKGTKTGDGETNDPCLSLLSSTTTAKNKKGTKKTKTRSTTSSPGSDGGDDKNNNGNYNMINSGGSNKWKKIQKFFFGPPGWSFNKSYKAYGPTTNEAKYKEALRPMHPHPKEDMYDQSTIRDSTYLHPIPNITNDQYKDKLVVKEEIIRKITPRVEKINSKEQINDVNTTNNPFKQHPNEIEKNQPWKLYESDVVSKEPISQEGKFLLRNQEDGQDRISSMGPMEKTIERTPSVQLGQQGAIISRPWLLKQEEFTSSQEELSESDKVSPTEEAKLPSQNLPSEPEKELTDTQENHATTVIMYNYANIPSNDQVESTKSINDNNNEIIYTDAFHTDNTIDITEAIDGRQLQLKPEEINDKKEKYEVSMVREDPELSFKPEATIELENPLNQTNIENSYLSNNQNNGIKGNKWIHIPDFNEPDYEQLKHLYSNIINRHATEHNIVTSRIENELDKIIKSNFNNIYNTNFENNMSDSSNAFMKAFGNFLKNGVPEIFPYHTAENLYMTSEPQINDVEKDDAFNQKAKQYFFLNTDTKLPTEQMNNSSEEMSIYNGDYKYNIETSLMPKPTNDNLEMLESNVELNDATIQKTMDGNTSAISSTTTVNQYTINLWPKYTDKTENIIDSTNLNTQSLVHSTSIVPYLELSSNYLKELNPTRAAGSSSTETTGRLSKSNESTELPKETKTFETLITLPLVFNNKDTETNNFSPPTKITTTKPIGHQSLLNLTLHPMLFDNLWGIQSYLNYSSYKPSSTTPNVFPDDKINFENIHEFNSDHHFQPTTLQSCFSNAFSSEWAPFNIPLEINEFGIISPSTVKISEVTQENMKKYEKMDFSNINDLMNELLKKSEMSLIEKNNKRNFTSLSKLFQFPSKINRGDFLLVNRPNEKPESMNKINKQVSHHGESVNDPVWNEIMYRTKLRKEKIESPIENESKSRRPHFTHQIYQNLRRPSFLKEEIIGDDLLNFLALPKATINNKVKGKEAESLTEPFLSNLKKIELMAQKMDGKNFDNIEVIKSGNDKTATQLSNNDLKFRNELNFWSNLNGPFSTEIEVFKESTNKFEQGKAKADVDYNRNATRWSIMEFQGKNVSTLDENKVDPQSIHNNEMLTRQPSATLLNDSKPIMPSNGWYAHNEQNEKLLASEKSFDRILLISTSTAVNVQKEIKSDHLKNGVGFLNSIANQPLPEIKNSSDTNKNEFSAIEMSAIKIIKKKPDLFELPMYDPIKNILNHNVNTEINREMSQMFMRMQDFANKLAMKKILLKRGITDFQNKPIEIDGSWRNKCPELPTNKTLSLPFFANLTHSKCKRSFSIYNTDEKGNNNIKNQPTNISDNWRYNMQSLIDKQNEKRNSDPNNNKADVKKDSDILLSMYHVKSSSNSDEKLFNDRSMKRNVVGNRKMKSRELEFILDRNLPRLPLNKRQFIAYMMTGLKGSGNPFSSEEEKHSQLSKAYLQNLIDRNVKKDKVVDLTNNKRPRKKQWQTNSFP